MKSIVDVVEHIAEYVSLPIIDAQYLPVWLMGRDYAVGVLNTHIRRFNSKPLPFRSTPPDFIEQSYSEHINKYWLAGYNATLGYVENYTNQMLKAA